MTLKFSSIPSIICPTVYNLGIRQFGISYDDLSDWGTNLNCGSQHAEVLKRVKDEWIPTKDDIKPLVLASA